MKGQLTTCACILPFYNEGDRIISVLSVLQRVSLLTEIICIDDGSTDGGAESIRVAFPSVKIISLQENHGKSYAVTKGVQAATAEYCLLMDADLQGLVPDELSKGIEIITRSKDTDMIIYRRTNDPWISKIIRGDILVSGERVLKTVDLKEILSEKLTGYQIELAINYYMSDKKKKVFWIYHSGKNVWKIAKIGWKAGAQKEVGFFMSALRFKGPRKHLVSVLTFCRNEALPR